MLKISTVTVLSRVKNIAAGLKKPMILPGGVFEVDKLRTYLKTKDNECWVIYALDKQNGQVVDIKALK